MGCWNCRGLATSIPYIQNLISDKLSILVLSEGVSSNRICAIRLLRMLPVLFQLLVYICPVWIKVWIAIENTYIRACGNTESTVDYILADVRATLLISACHTFP